MKRIWLLVNGLALGAAFSAGANPLSEGLALQRSRDDHQALLRFHEAWSTATDDRTRFKAALLSARSNNALTRFADALKDLARTSDLTDAPDLMELRAFERARALAGSEAPEAIPALQGFIAGHGASPLVTQASLLLGQAAARMGNAALATEVLAPLTASSARDIRSEAMLALALVAPLDRRVDLLTQVFVTLPDTPAATRTGLKESDLTQDRLLARADAFHDAMDYEQAQRLWEGAWVAGEGRPDLAYKLARSHLIEVRDDPDRAMKMLDFAETGGAVSAEDALFLRARALARKEDYSQAAALYRTYLARWPRGKRAVEARYFIAWMPYDHREYRKALPLLDDFLTRVKKHELRSYILWAKAWSLYRLGRYEPAIRALSDMIPLGNNLVAGKAMYWGGMAYHKLRQSRSARTWMKRVIDEYPLSYYAVLAAKRLQQWDKTPLPAWMVGPRPSMKMPPTTNPPALTPEDSALLQRVRDLSDVGEKARARALYAGIAARVEEPLKDHALAAWLLEISQATEEYSALPGRARATWGRQIGDVPTPMTSLYWQMSYPEAWRSLASVDAARFGISPLWVYSIMRQESRYKPRQISHTAALGVMQMIPKTAKIVGSALGLPFVVERFFEPGENLLFCTYYLAALLREFKGAIVFASAAYNGGAPAITRFMKRDKGLPFDEMVEQIPYNESRNYARKVAEHLVRYAYLYLDPAPRRQLLTTIFPDQVDYDLIGEVDY